MHVGKTSGGREGIQQRLKNHMQGSSSFVKKYFKRKYKKLRKTCRYQYIVVRKQRTRALLEAYAIGQLCPKHIGKGKKESKKCKTT